MLHPRIYLPSALEESSVPHVLAHENAHLARKDHWWKPLGFGLLCLHWFNPILWLAYILLCKDIELACDEKVIQALGEGEKRSYSQALLQCSVPRHLIAACPLAFGEVGVKERVKTVLNYKKPAFWIILIALIVCVAVAVCFLTDPVSEDDPTPSLPITEDASSFWAEVLEVNGNSLLVRPEPGAWEARSADKITLSVPDGCAIPAVGDRVHIVYDGQLACSYPAQIHHCTSISIVGKSLSQLSSGCSPEQIVAQGGYLMINSDCVAGKDAMRAFFQGAKQGYPATIRYADYFTLGDPARYGDEYYSQMLDTHPQLYVHDLTFTGTEYILRWFENGQEIVHSYSYLLHFTGGPESAYADYESWERYVLCDRNDVTWEQIFSGSVSADFKDQIPYHCVYTDFQYANEPTLTDLEQAKNQLTPYIQTLNITYLDVNPVTGMLDIRAGEYSEELFKTIKQFVGMNFVTVVIDGIVPDIQIPFDSPIGLSLELLDANFHGATIRYTVDPKNADAVWANHGYRLKVFTQSGWQDIPGYDPLQITWEDACLFYESEGNPVVCEEQAQWSRLSLWDLEPGQYHFSKDIFYTVDGQTHVLTIQTVFELVPYHVSMRIEQGDNGESDIVLSHRLTGTGEIWAYQDFTLEHQVKGEWIAITSAGKNDAPFWFKGTGHNDPNGPVSILRYRLDLSELTDQKLEPGLYRISVPVYITVGDSPAYQISYVETVSAQFAVMPDVIPSYGSVEEAILDGCVTMVNGDIVAGQRIWKNFVNTTDKGQAASVRIFEYLTLSRSSNYDPEHFQEVFSQYPVVVIHDLVYDGHLYSLSSYQNGKGNFSQFPYLLHYTGGPEDQYADYEAYDRYVLCNDNTMTWEELRSHMGISFTHVRQQWIVMDLIYQEEPTLEQLEAVMNQLDDYWVEYEIVSMDANELTNKLDIRVSRWVDGLDTLIERYIPLRWVTITHQDGWAHLEEVTGLVSRFPEYFDLSTHLGLELYALEDGYVLMANASQAKNEQQIQAMPRATSAEMALILESYQVHIDPMHITVINRTDRTEYDIRKELGIYPECNVMLDLTDITAEGATITYIIYNLDDKEVWAGPEFHLEVWTENGWQPYGYDKDQLAWNEALVFHMVGKDPDQTVFVTEDRVMSTVSWSAVADVPLPSGMYQLCKPIYIHSNGQTWEHTRYAIITIP